MLTSQPLKIYFGASIRGGRNDAELYKQLIAHAKRFGDVLTEHVGDTSQVFPDEHLQDEFIYKRDMTWLRDSNAFIAEVTTPSLGVGYEIRSAEGEGIPILCLFRPSAGTHLSGMINGNPNANVREYANIYQAQTLISGFLEEVQEKLSARNPTQGKEQL
jgi:2'-deoxynucleoside 5'-phosphate N-hydrolase